jgi:hypothetical protein
MWNPLTCFEVLWRHQKPHLPLSSQIKCGSVRDKTSKSTFRVPLAG